MPENKGNVGSQRDIAKFALDFLDEEMYWIRPDATIAHVNDASCRELGYSYEEFIGLTVCDFDPAFTPAIWEQQWARLKETRHLVFETLHRKKDGSVIPVEVSASYVSLHNEEYSVAFARDISERKRSERILKESEERLRLVVENMPVLVDAFDKDKLIVMWNRECERVTGYSSSEVINRPDIMDALYPDPVYRAWVWETVAKHAGDFRGIEMDIRCKDGAVKTIAWSNVSKLFRISGWDSWAIGIDITEKKQSQLCSEHELHLRETLMNAMPLQVFYKDLQGSYLGVNAAFLDWFGISEEQAIGKTVFDIAPSEIAQKYYDMDQELFRNPGRQQYEWVIRKGAVDRQVVFGKATFTDSAGNVAGLVGVIMDISERKRMQEELELKLDELESVNRFMVDRELKMVELKEQIQRLREENDRLRGAGQA